ncbi:hypothetical protein [uncultured Microbulbifer sp.]|uniref:AbiU2 domain-containing protein n=1 Tax=uncultured Microbulbifer sp. TaxID=348147 RepID=UPI002603A03A|nr:hypothetical protein [uncultured Microbulbifer sp.]
MKVRCAEQELQECFANVKDSVNAALGHYQIWFTLRGKGKAIDEYLSVMNDYRYVDFFHAANIAHYKLMFIETGCIFDTDDRADRCMRLKELMIENGFRELAAKFDTNLKPFRKLVSNILTVRSKLIAHKESNVEPADLYGKHGIKPDDIKALLNELSELMGNLESLMNNGASWSSVGPTDRWENATYGLLEVLREGRNS